MEEKQKKILQWVFVGIMGVGLVLIFVGMFLGLVKSDQLNLTYKLVGDEKWDLHADMITNINSNINPDYKVWFESSFGYSNTFAVIAFVVAIIGGALVITYSVLKNMNKKIKVLGIIAGLVMVVGTALVIAAGAIMANNLGKLYWCYFDREVMTEEPNFFSIGVGAYLGFVGGLLIIVTSFVSGLKAFKN